MDWRDKHAEYAGAGIESYWILDPAERSVTTFRLADGRYYLRERFCGEGSFQPEELPGLEVSLSRLFR